MQARDYGVTSLKVCKAFLKWLDISNAARGSQARKHYLVKELILMLRARSPRHSTPDAPPSRPSNFLQNERSLFDDSIISRFIKSLSS
jgi:hypothetical protein